MAVEVVIRQKGLLPIFKKTLPRAVLLGDTLECGQYEKNYLIAPYDETDGLVLYNTEAAGRGIRTSWTPKAKDEIGLRLELPCHSREVTELVGIIRRISEYWKCTVELEHADGTTSAITNLPRYEEQTARFNRLLLGDLVSDTLAKNERTDNPDRPAYNLLQCALWPLGFGPKQATKVQEDASYFDWWLHKAQCVEARYCYPDFWRLESGLIEGQYDVIAGRPHLLPYRPYVADWSCDMKTGERMKADVFRINFFSETGEQFIGDIPYDLWTYTFPREKCLAYDACHFWLDACSSEELLDICRRALEVTDGTAQVTIGEQRWNVPKGSGKKTDKIPYAGITKSEQLAMLEKRM